MLSLIATFDFLAFLVWYWRCAFGTFGLVVCCCCLCSIPQHVPGSLVFSMLNLVWCCVLNVASIVPVGVEVVWDWLRCVCDARGVLSRGPRILDSQCFGCAWFSAARMMQFSGRLGHALGFDSSCGCLGRHLDGSHVHCIVAEVVGDTCVLLYLSKGSCLVAKMGLDAPLVICP
ncbi:hypothetical protein Nepgr_023934 [Nepenthes gracilis]|uniref:Uncharacterized protein n=1 Tax=Nepenthes gracilis TaxID=150966 RepID=A0AAD3T3R9_NEPGR|nr:hypothetical protein Nepgr_023934 [Nepenthes gracilis]